MNLYKITRDTPASWDEFRGAVVAAETVMEAVKIHPRGREIEDDDSWVPHTAVSAEWIGTAVPGTKQGVILADFKAG